MISETLSYCAVRPQNSIGNMESALYCYFMNFSFYYFDLNQTICAFYWHIFHYHFHRISTVPRSDLLTFVQTLFLQHRHSQLTESIFDPLRTHQSKPFWGDTPLRLLTSYAPLLHLSDDISSRLCNGSAIFLWELKWMLQQIRVVEAFCCFLRRLVRLMKTCIINIGGVDTTDNSKGYCQGEHSVHEY